MCLHATPPCTRTTAPAPPHFQPAALLSCTPDVRLIRFVDEMLWSGPARLQVYVCDALLDDLNWIENGQVQ